MEQTQDTGDSNIPKGPKYNIHLVSSWEDELDEIAAGFCEEFMNKYKSRYSIFYPPEHQLGGSRYLTLPDDTKFTIAVITDSFLKNNTVQYIQQVCLIDHLKNENHYFIPVAIGLKNNDLPTCLQAMSVIHFDKDFKQNIKGWERLDNSICKRNGCDLENNASYPKDVVGELWKPVPPVSYYFNRTELHHHLQKHMETMPCLVLSGIHGCGKTQLARYLMNNTETFQNQIPQDKSLGSEYNGIKKGSKPGIRYEVNCHSIEKMLGSLEILAKHLGLTANDNLCRSPSENAKQLLRTILECLNQDRCASHNMLLFEDVKTQTDNILNPSMIQKCSNTKIIVTTTIGILWPLCQKYCVPLKGFTKREVIQFFRTENEQCRETDDSISVLGERLSFLPLGLAVAKSYMKFYSESIADYLYLLPNFFKDEGKFFKEDEYDKGVIAAMQRALDSFKSEIGKEPFHALEIVALLAPYRIPLQIVCKILPGSYKDKLAKEKDIIAGLQNQSLASIQKNDQNQRIMNIHEIVQLALQLNWSKQENHILCEEAAFVLAGLVDKDYRVLEAYNTQWEFVPHVQTLLKHISKLNRSFDNTRAQISEIKLLEFLGHMYSKTSTLHAEKTLLLSRRKAFEYFLGKSELKIDHEARHYGTEDESIFRKKAKCMHAILQNQLFSEETLTEFVLKKTYSKQWYSRWEEKLQTPLADSLKKELQLGCLTISQYEEFIQLGLALPVHVVCKVYIPELLVSTMFTYALVLFRDALEKQQLSEDLFSICQESFQVSFELSELICEDLKASGCKGKLKHWLVVQEKGLMQIPLAVKECNFSHQEIVADISKVKQQYGALRNLNIDLYQQGVFKGDVNHRQTKVSRMRQLIRCHRILLKHAKGVKQWNDIMRDAQEFLSYVEMEFKQNTLLFQEFVNSVDYYVELAMLLLQLGGSDNLEKAKSYLTEYLDLPTLTGTSHVKALTCLTNVCLEKKSNQDLQMCLQKLRKHENEQKTSTINKLIGFQSVKNNNLQEMTNLIQKIQNEIGESEV